MFATVNWLNESLFEWKAAWGGPGGIKEEKEGSWRGSRHENRQNKDEATDFSNNNATRHRNVWLGVEVS